VTFATTLLTIERAALARELDVGILCLMSMS